MRWISAMMCTLLLGTGYGAELLTNTVWGDIAQVDVQGITFGMTRQEVAKTLGEMQVSAYNTGVPYLYKMYADGTNIETRLTLYFGISGECSNRVVGIESSFYKATMPDRNTVVDTLQEKFGFEDHYLEHKPKGSTGLLKNDYDFMPQYEQHVNDNVAVIFRVEWDNKKQRTYLITVFYRHRFYTATIEALRAPRSGNEEERRKEQIRDFL